MLRIFWKLLESWFLAPAVLGFAQAVPSVANVNGYVTPTSNRALSVKKLSWNNGTYNSGFPALSQVASGALAATTYFVRLTLIINGVESAPSPEASFAVSLNNVLVVASPGAFPGVTGYNVYVSTTTGTETRQNGGVPIAIGTPWQEPNGGLVGGAALPTQGAAFQSGLQVFASGFGLRGFDAAWGGMSVGGNYIAQPQLAKPGAQQMSVRLYSSTTGAEIANGAALTPDNVSIGAMGG